ncbi:RelA/SpoT domain-containing protein [Oceanidesulfovibrio marinus]|uniref:RelA/SpoT domain-containing protein n=1 Tax=Oceanidesulfovibrio marinus TaxID=370038 RepID=A0ABX6NEV4_9BACT|nr:RelA/SpoT domain-containing protein [Oceanidesulfovibrio marinus]QJT09137.1 hypothetical protein E8L03_09400 [Oceanidesulfovibrio marinus]
MPFKEKMISKSAFCNRYNKTEDDFEKAAITWEELTEIYYSYISDIQSLESVGKNVVDILRGAKDVHSTRMRIKDAYHLVEKILRKKAQKDWGELNLHNYKDIVKDLIGVRALHIHKHDCINIHTFIVDTWPLCEEEPPEANIRKGDDTEHLHLFSDPKPGIKINESGYRSIHYVIISSPTKRSFNVEIQVRTIFEEGWSEIDHQIRYPINRADKITSGLIQNLSQQVGAVGELAQNIQTYHITKKTEDSFPEEPDEVHGAADTADNASTLYSPPIPPYIDYEQFLNPPGISASDIKSFIRYLSDVRAPEFSSTEIADALADIKYYNDYYADILKPTELDLLIQSTFENKYNDVLYPKTLTPTNSQDIEEILHTHNQAKETLDSFRRINDPLQEYNRVKDILEEYNRARDIMRRNSHPKKDRDEDE